MDGTRDRGTPAFVSRGLVALTLLGMAAVLIAPRRACAQSAPIAEPAHPASLAVEPAATPAAPAPVPPPPPDEDIARTRWIQSVLDDGNSYANLWYYFWVATQGVLFVGQTAVAVAVSDPQWRPAMAVGAATALVGVLPMVLFPMDACSAARALRAEPLTTAEQRHHARLRAEQLLRASAENERFGRSWGMHAIGWIGSAIAGIVLWLGFQQPMNGLATFVFGVVGGELQLLTQPLAASVAWSDYERAHTAADLGRRSMSRTPRGFRMVLSPATSGVGASWSF